MHGMKRIPLALLAAGMIAGPAMAGELEDLKARVEALEKHGKDLDSNVGNLTKNFNVVTQGEEAPYIKWPGSQTGFNIYGYAHLAVYKDLKGRNRGDWAASIADQPSSTNGDNRSGKFNMTARQSRFGIKTLTLTDMGKLQTKIEGDFVQSRNGNFSDGADGTAGYTNGYQFRLRHAYGEMAGDWGTLLAGQTWSNFMSGDAIPETLDFNGSGSTNSLRNPQIRYTLNTDAAGSFAVAVENSYNRNSNKQMQVNNDGSENISRRPDVTANWTKTFDWGFVSAQAVNTQWEFDDGTNSAKAQGLGWGLSAQLKATAKDTFVVQTNGGKGLGRYVTLADIWTYNTGYNATSDKIEMAKTRHWSVGYARAWTDTVRTNLALSGTSGKNGDGSDGNKYNEAFVNVIYGIAQNTEVGLEYYMGKAKFKNDPTYNWAHADGDEAKASRVLATFQYNF